MNIRQLVLDVDKAVARPSLVEIATAINGCNGVEAINIAVEEIDIETVGMGVTIEGIDMDYEEIVKAIESTGAVVHSLDQLVTGNRIIPRISRAR
jgi:hypothetical protein